MPLGEIGMIELTDAAHPSRLITPQNLMFAAP
jgi:hypothetical protein